MGAEEQKKTQVLVLVVEVVEVEVLTKIVQQAEKEIILPTVLHKVMMVEKDGMDHIRILIPILQNTVLLEEVAVLAK